MKMRKDFYLCIFIDKELRRNILFNFVAVIFLCVLIEIICGEIKRQNPQSAASNELTGV